ncbi:phage portal protein family protein, partial [Streptomyces galilaeus]|uniref:phage portal protein family protein n=1 Tax=Streptomyces galilaeus TaxID=33899 RepID=UPI0038F60DCD
NRRLPRSEFDNSTSDEMRDLAYPLRSLVSLGMKVPKSWVHERLNIPIAKDGDDVLEAPTELMSNNTAALKASSLAVLKSEGT